MSEIELAWAAGFFDGEGSTTTNKHGRMQIGIGQVDPRVLERFKEAVGLGRVYGPYQPTNPKWSSFYHYQVGGKKGMVVLEKLWPYLGAVKTDQVQAAWLKRLDILDSRKKAATL